MANSHATKQSDRLAIKGIILTSLLTLLSACGNSAAIESLVSPDPALKKGSTEEVSARTKIQSDAEETSDNEDTVDSPDPNIAPSPVAESNDNGSPRVREDDTAEPPSTENSVSNLILNFPETFPVYPQAELQEIKSSEDKDAGNADLANDR